MDKQTDMKRVRFRPMDFTSGEISDVSERGRMLVLKAETSKVCELNCLYCYRKDDKKAGVTKEAELGIEERIALLNEAAALGVKAYHIVGAGEPLRDPYFPDQLRKARELGMEVMVPTDGIQLDIDKNLDFLEETGASILLKLNSFRENIERRLTRKNGYAEIRNRVLEKILKRQSFNRSENSESGAVTTRLAVSTMITNINLEDSLEVLKFCRENNISPFITTFLNIGRTSDEIGLTPNKRDIEDIFKKAKEQDYRMGIDDGDGSIYLVGQECNQRGIGIYVNIEGEIRNCVGETEPIGNIREMPLNTMWKNVRKQNEEYRSNGRIVCPPRQLQRTRLMIVK